MEGPLADWATTLTDEQLWANLMWASLAIDFQPQSAAFYSEAYKQVADTGTVWWDVYTAEADSRPSMSDWRTLPQLTTDLAKARKGGT